MNTLDEIQAQQTRRMFLENATLGLGAMALGTLASSDLHAQSKGRNSIGGLVGLPHFAPKAKRIIYLFQSGGPSQMDLFDYKPKLAERFGEEVPKSIYPDERKTTMTSGQKSFPVAPTTMRFARHGEAGIWLGETLPHLAQVIDDVCVIKSMYTDAINHDPAATLFQTGSVIPGRPSMGSWVSYGLGSTNANLPAFVALTSNGSAKQGQPLYDRLWGAGFLPGRFQGVKFRGQGDPILDLYNPAGVTREQRSRMLDSLSRLNQQQSGRFNDPAIATRIAQYELAFRMQMSVPDLIDFRSEPKRVLDMYGVLSLSKSPSAAVESQSDQREKHGSRFAKGTRTQSSTKTKPRIDEHSDRSRTTRPESIDGEVRQGARWRRLRQDCLRPGEVRQRSVRGSSGNGPCCSRPRSKAASAGDAVRRER